MYNNSKNSEIEKIVQRFSEFIKLNIQKLNPENLGIDSDDIAQEIKIKLWKILKSEKKIKNLSSYIRKVIYTTTIDVIRKTRKEREHFFTKGKEMALKRMSPENSAHQKEIREAVENALESLKEPRRQVVKLYLLEMNINEISDFLNFNKDRTRNLLYRGLADLKEKLKEKGINYEIKK